MLGSTIGGLCCIRRQISLRPAVNFVGTGECLFAGGSTMGCFFAASGGIICYSFFFSGTSGIFYRNRQLFFARIRNLGVSCWNRPQFFLPQSLVFVGTSACLNYYCLGFVGTNTNFSYHRFRFCWNQRTFLLPLALATSDAGVAIDVATRGGQHRRGTVSRSASWSYHGYWVQ